MNHAPCRQIIEIHLTSPSSVWVFCQNLQKTWNRNLFSFHSTKRIPVDYSTEQIHATWASFCRYLRCSPYLWLSLEWVRKQLLYIISECGSRYLWQPRQFWHLDRKPEHVASEAVFCPIYVIRGLSDLCENVHFWFQSAKKSLSLFVATWTIAIWNWNPGRPYWNSVFCLHALPDLCEICDACRYVRRLFASMAFQTFVCWKSSFVSPNFARFPEGGGGRLQGWESVCWGAGGCLCWK